MHRRMRHTGTRHAPGRALGTAVGVVLTAAVTLGVTAGPASAAPRRPSDTQVQQAQAAADAATAQLGQLQTQMATAQAHVADAQAASAIALDDYQQKQADFQAAQTVAQAAQAAAAQAAAALQASQDQLTAFARRSYMEGSTYAGASSLMTADGPAQLLERAALLDAAGAHRGDQVTTFTAARQQADTADATAQTALTRAGTLQQQASDALAVAQTAERAARDEQAGVAAQRTQLQAQVDAARAQLVSLIGAQQAADRVAQQQAAAAAAAAAAAQSSSHSSGSSNTADDRPAAGPGSASAAQRAIDAARAYLGTPYSWGGGDYRGPGKGISVEDANVVGFDCSGLTQYAYYQAGILIPRNSRSQYASLPKVAAGDLQPGDLVFWATDTSDPTTIHHVAIYLGGGKVIQAPESGDVVKISNMWPSGYIGAVRPSAR